MHLLMHEEGHRLGLEHSENRSEDNLMSYRNPFSNVVTDTQKLSIVEHFMQLAQSSLQSQFTTPGKSTAVYAKTLNFGDDPMDQVNDLLKYQSSNYNLKD